MAGVCMQKHLCQLIAPSSMRCRACHLGTPGSTKFRSRYREGGMVGKPSRGGLGEISGNFLVCWGAYSTQVGRHPSPRRCTKIPNRNVPFFRRACAVFLRASLRVVWDGLAVFYYCRGSFHESNRVFLVVVVRSMTTAVLRLDG